MGILPATAASPRRTCRDARRGFTVLLVLALISMTLGVSYALVRSQTSSAKMALNRDLSAAARQAAWTGLSAGMRRISQTTWGGVGSTVTGNLTGSGSYSVTFTTGDAQLTTTSADAADWPYRVTISAIGYATDPTKSAAATAYKVEGVVRLVPRAVASNPSAWSTMLSHVFYQTQADNLTVQLPLQINGPMRWQGSLQNFATTYPLPTSARDRYLGDLNAMRSNGYADARPFTGPITMPTASTTTTNRNLLSSSLGITVTNASAVSTSNFNHPGSPTSYRLYTGGPTFTIPSLASSISNTTYQPDPRTNPAGLFLRSGDLTIGNNTTIVGTVITTGNLIFTGTNITLQPASLAALTGTTAVTQLPAVVANQDVRASAGSRTTIAGVVVSFGNFVSLAGSDQTTFDLRGNLVARSLDIQSRSEWNLGSFWWALVVSAFNSQLSNSNPVVYFPVYVQGVVGLNYSPLLTIRGPTGSVTRQWFAPDTPVYSVGSGDAGLMWSTVRMTELH